MPAAVLAPVNKLTQLKHTAVSPPTGSQMGLAYMRKSEFRSAQFTPKLRADGLKPRFSLSPPWTPDPASQRKVSTGQHVWQNTVPGRKNYSSSVTVIIFCRLIKLEYVAGV